MKRTFDCVAALVGLAVLSPLLAGVAVIIRLSSPGPVLFRQRRVGRNFKPFDIYKFRTMCVDAEEHGGLLTMMQDARVTRIGYWLRLFKIDELPQLVNVLKGEMSVVGPRPEVPRYVDLFRDDYATILTVRPGLTDLASLKYRHEADVLARLGGDEAAYLTKVLPDKIRLAKVYVANASFSNDVVLILRTCLSVLRPDSAVRPQKSRSAVRGALPTAILRYRRVLVLGAHLVLVVLTNYLAFWLRFDGRIPAGEIDTYFRFLPALVLIRMMSFAVFRLNEGLWRYTGMWDLSRIVAAVCLSSLLFFGLVHLTFAEVTYPRSVFVLDALLLVCAMSAGRVAHRAYAELLRAPRDRRVLIYGAGDAGELIVRDMLRHPDSRYEPIGFLDDDPRKVGMRIHGVPVVGGRADLARVITQYNPAEVLVALPSAFKTEVRKVVEALGAFPIPITTVPDLKDILDGHVTVQQIRTLQIEDLLARNPVNLDIAHLQALVTGQCVMVTGAGGSIGSELCRQIAALQPGTLLLFERYENALYQIATELQDGYPSLVMAPLLGDICDRDRVDAVVGHYKPSVIFHAAAHKHVPLVEQNPCEAIKNNVLGTRVVATAAIAHRVARFVLISSDKAVNPSSVMGATKRVAELVTRSLNGPQTTQFTTVRFGNVLGSNGSVVPRFLDQIRAGGPVTVTHPDIRRFFMLIPEAVQLVMLAAAVDEYGGLYVLEMGEQIKLVDMARNLIRLSGFVPDEDVAITFTGLRPGEKLYEELVGTDETVEPAPLPSIIRVRFHASPNPEEFARRVALLERAALDGIASETIRHLCALVPTFTPDAIAQRAGDAGSIGPSGQRTAEWVRRERRDPERGDRRQVLRGGRRRDDRLGSRPVDALTAGIASATLANGHDKSSAVRNNHWHSSDRHFSSDGDS